MADNAVLAALQQADSEYEGVAPTDGFELHPIFKGVATVDTARLETKDNGQVQLFVKFKTEHGQPAIWQALSKFKNEQQVGFTKKVLLHLGHTGTFADLANHGTAHMIGNQVEIQVKHETFDGSLRERVYTNRAVGGDLDPDGAGLASFASQFNATEVDPSLPANFPGQPATAEVV